MRNKIISILVKLMIPISLTKVEIVSFCGSNQKPDIQKRKITFQNTMTQAHGLQN